MGVFPEKSHNTPGGKEIKRRQMNNRSSATGGESVRGLLVLEGGSGVQKKGQGAGEKQTLPGFVALSQKDFEFGTTKLKKKWHGPYLHSGRGKRRIIAR